MDPLTLGLIAGGSAGIQALSGLYGANQQRVASRDQLRALGRAQGAITGAYDKAQGYQTPYLQAGQEGLSRMMGGNYDVAVPGQPTMPGEYVAPEFRYQEDPGMAYRMRIGQQAVQSGAAAQGQGLSGSTLKALARFGQDLGSQEYGNAFDRYMAQRRQGLGEYQTNLGRAQDIWGQQKDVYGMGAEQAQRRYGRAADLGQMGQTAAGNLSNMASDYGSNLAGLYGIGGQIKAAGRTAAANSMMQGIGGAANTGMDYLTLQSLMGGGGKSRINAGERML